MVSFNLELLSDRFDTSGSPVALFDAKIWSEIQKEYRNHEIQKSKHSFIPENLKSPLKSGRYDTS